MAKSSNYNGLNPIVVQALNNLQYRYSGETPEMWCSRVCYPFKKLLEYNPKYFSKNGFIQMIERIYIDGGFKAGRRSFHIYCTVCDSLVIIRENTIKCDNDHLKKCIAKRRSNLYKRIRKKEEGQAESVYLHLVLMRLMKFMIIFILDTKKALNVIFSCFKRN